MVRADHAAHAHVIARHASRARATEENHRVMLSAAKWGALVGVAIYLLSQFITFIGDVILGAGTPADPSHPGKIALGCVNLLLIIFAFSTSGFYTGRETRQAGYGAIAGMVTFAVFGALSSLYTYGGRAALGAPGEPLGMQIVVGLITAVLYLCISALIGWLGGRPGATQGRARAARIAQEQAPQQ